MKVLAIDLGGTHAKCAVVEDKQVVRSQLVQTGGHARLELTLPEFAKTLRALTALDVAHTQQFSKLLRDIVDRTRATVVFASHDLNWAAAYSDRIVVLDNGAVAADMTPAELMKPDVVRRLFGFEAEAVMVAGKVWLVQSWLK